MSEEIIKLNDNATILELKIGKWYFGKKEKNGIRLNKSIFIPLKNIKFINSKNRKEENENKKNSTPNNYAVLIKKIIYPDTIIADAKQINTNQIKENITEVRIVDNNKEKLNEISEFDLGKTLKIEGIVDKVIQTSGPTLFKIIDDTGSFIIKGFYKPGKRAYPEIKENDGIRAIIKVVEHNDMIEGEILSIKKIKLNKQDILRKLNEKIKPSGNFSIESKVYESMKELFIEAALEIKKAIYESRPIILRHHADCDGFSGAIALEESILKIMSEVHKDSKTNWILYNRIANKTPFLDYSDASRDLGFFLDDMIKFGNKEPLYIILDFGSSNESLLAYKKLKMFGAKIIVIDHHFSSLEQFNEIKKVVDIFINPHEHNGDESITAGMLGYELSLFIKKHDYKHLPVVSGFGDRSNSNEFESYCQEFSKEECKFFKKLAEVIDYEAYHIRNAEAREYFRALLLNPETQKRLVELIYPEIEKIWKLYEKIILQNMRVINETPFVILLENISHQFDFPGIGKITGFAKDLIVEKYKRNDVVVLYALDESIVFRSEIEIKINEKIQELKQKYPEFLVDGGGHAKAASIRFLSIGKEQILKDVLNWLKSINLKE